VKPTFGIMTAPMNVGYDDIVRVWREADTVEAIDHAWVFDHLMPIGGDPDGPALEGWTLLAALAALATRLELGVMVSSNRFRPPAVLAKIATTVDVIAGGRLQFGIGVGSRPDHPLGRREYDAHGLPFIATADAVTALDEACTVIRRLWTEPAPFDFAGEQVRLTGAFGNPKPVRVPPVLIGGRSAATLRVAARHADIWNIPGGDHDDVVARSALLDRYCEQIGRDPARITRSVHFAVDHEHPQRTRDAIAAALDAGFRHFVLSPQAPYPAGLAHWLADRIIPGGG